MTQFKKILLAASALLFSTSALAVPTIEITTSSQTIVVQDGDANDFSHFAGAVGFVGSVGGIDFNLEFAVTEPFTVQDNILRLRYIVQNDTDETVTIKFSETGFDSLPEFDAFRSVISGQGAEDATVSYDTFVDNSNVLFGEGDQVASMDFGPFAADAEEYGDDTIFGPVPGLANPFSLTQIVTVSHGANGGLTKGDAILKAVVPEPAPLALLGIALLGLGLTSRRRAKA